MEICAGMTALPEAQGMVVPPPVAPESTLKRR
jgi:hypothetical protein